LAGITLWGKSNIFSHPGLLLIHWNTYNYENKRGALSPVSIKTMPAKKIISVSVFFSRAADLPMSQFTSIQKIQFRFISDTLAFMEFSCYIHFACRDYLYQQIVPG